MRPTSRRRRPAPAPCRVHHRPLPTVAVELRAQLVQRPAVLVEHDGRRFVADAFAAGEHAVEHLQVAAAPGRRADIEGRIEASDSLEHGTTEGHVGAGAELPGAEDGSGPRAPGRADGGLPTSPEPTSEPPEPFEQLLGRGLQLEWQDETGHRGEPGFLAEGARQGTRPALVDDGVVVGERDDLGPGLGDRPVASVIQPGPGLHDVVELWELGGDEPSRLRGRRCVVDHDDPDVVAPAAQRCEASSELLRPIPRAHGHRHRRHRADDCELGSWAGADRGADVQSTRRRRRLEDGRQSLAQERRTQLAGDRVGEHGRRALVAVHRDPHGAERLAVGAHHDQGEHVAVQTADRLERSVELEVDHLGPQEAEAVSLRVRSHESICCGRRPPASRDGFRVLAAVIPSSSPRSPNWCRQLGARGRTPTMYEPLAVLGPLARSEIDVRDEQHVVSGCDTGRMDRPGRGSHVLDPDLVEWAPTDTPGFWEKQLLDDGQGGSTVLMRVDPGAHYGVHHHDQLEEIFVLDGEFSDEERTYGPRRLLRPRARRRAHVVLFDRLHRPPRLPLLSDRRSGAGPCRPPDTAKR